MRNSVQRSGARHTHPIPPVPGQPMKHCNDVFVARLCKRVISHLYGLGKKLVVVHGGIVRERCCCGHSYFPIGLDVAIVFKAAFNRIPFVLNTLERK